MKKKYRRYLISSLLLSVLFFAIGLFGIYALDPAGVNNRFNFGLIKDSGLTLRTQKFVELNEVKPNTILLGGSRMHFMNPKLIQKYTNDNVYNVAFSISTLEEQYQFLKYSIEKFDIKNVVIGLNLYTFSEKLKVNENTDYDVEMFKKGFTWTKQVKYYMEFPLNKYFSDYVAKGYAKPLFKDGGRTAYAEKLYADNKSWEAREAEVVDGYSKFYYNEYLTWGESGFNHLRNMVKLCKENGVELKLFTTTVHNSQLDILKKLNKTDIFLKWKKELATIAPYYDFMYYHHISKNSDNYNDPSHLLQQQGDLYFYKIFKNRPLSKENDIGILVTEENIERHLEFLVENLKN
ncbi:MAG: hypothetical protein KAG56_03860 [Sulfurovaceae bacterium]|nr:hypothetical protein [Sulfurovaceae bacterium]